MKRTRKKAREDVAERALDEKVTADGLGAGATPWSPGGKTEFEDEDFPAWDRGGSPVPKEYAALAVVEWLFGGRGYEDGRGPGAVMEEVSRDVSPGRRRTEVRAEPVPKSGFSSLEEFVPEAEASGEFREEARK